MSQRDVYVNALLEQVFLHHIYYSQSTPGRCHPNQSGWADCSGFVSFGMNVAGISWPCDGSFSQATRAFEAGTQISVEKARVTRGAWVFQGVNQGRGGVPGVDHGHVATSLGDGRTVEARGHVAGVNVFLFNSLQWDGAYLPPGLTGFDQTPDPNPGPGTPQEAKAMGMTAANIIPGAHPQTKDPWKGREPFVGAQQNSDGTTDLVGFNGAALQGGIAFAGASVVHLGHLNAPIESVSPNVDGRGNYSGEMVGLAGDGGSFTVAVTVHYL